MSNERGVPVQDLLENQDPMVLFNLNEVTGEVTPIERPAPAEEPKPRKRAKREVVDAAAEGEGE